MNWEILKVADVNMAEIGKLLNVSRVTVHHWVHGKSKVADHRTKKVSRLLAAMESAVAAGDLPLAGCSRGDRSEKLIAVLVQHLKQS